MSPFDPFRGGGRQKGTMSPFFTVFFLGDRPLITISNLDHNPTQSHLEGHPDVHLRAALRGEDQIVNGEHVAFLFWAKLMFKYLLRC